MDESPAQPLVFAHKVIKQFVDHLVGDDVRLERNDYAVIRLAFRYAKGSWESVWAGDPVHLELLKKVVLQWGATVAIRVPKDPEGVI